MGWGTFAAGLALSWARSSPRPDSPVLGEALGKALKELNNKFLESYIRRVLRGTAILHPAIWNSVDLAYWEAAITKRAARDWRILAGIQVAVVIVGAISFWPLLFLYVPGFWYFGKSQAIRSYSAEINKEFSAEGFDVRKLTAEIPHLLDDERIAEQRDAQERSDRLAELEYRKKFGKPKQPGPA